MFNDDVLARCPDCGSADTVISHDAIRCSACGLNERFTIDEEMRAGTSDDVAAALDKGRMREILLRWNFAG